MIDRAEEIEDSAMRAVLDYARRFPEPPAYDLSGGTYTLDDLQRQSDFHFLLGVYVTLSFLRGEGRNRQEVTQDLYTDVAGARNFIKMEAE